MSVPASSRGRAALLPVVLLAASPWVKVMAKDEAPPWTAEDIPILETVVVEAEATPRTKLGPMEGLSLEKNQIAGNVQSVTRETLRASRATSLGDLLNSNLQSINVNDYQGNPFQMDITYRGFSASPQIGTPQGLSVFLDGVRVNEPFGDIVNWDLIPMNALSGMEMFPGSNPLFGLNTLGGAMSLRTRNGFDDAGADLSFTGGSWNRKKGELSLGGHNGALGGFLAFTGFDEDGWRNNSPSRVMQGFSRVDWRGDRFNVHATGLWVGNKLLGNGLLPLETYWQRPEAVFSSPDQTENDLQHYKVGGEFFVTDTFSITGQIYRRGSNRVSLAGDIYEDFREMENGLDTPRVAQGSDNGNPICQFQDINHDGIPDYALTDPVTGEVDPATINIPVTRANRDSLVRVYPLNGDECGRVKYVPVSPDSGPRNGAYGDFRNLQPGLHSTGWEPGTPIGVLSKTAIRQVTDGAAMQFNWNLDRHKFMFGGAIDARRSAFDTRQKLGTLDAAHRFVDGGVDPIFVAGREYIPNNVFNGQSQTWSGYFSETWSPRDNLHMSLSGRYNHTTVKNRMKARTRAGFDILSDLQDIHTYRPNVIVCPSADPASCPAAATYNLKSWNRDALLSGESYYGLGQFGETPTSESFDYKAFNPAFGITYSPTERLNAYFNFSQGNRAPSSVELGCGYDATLVPQDPYDPNSPKIPKSLASIGGSCTLPTTLSGDPYLPQIFSRSYEFGLRGKMLNDWEWNASVYRTDLTDDIYLMGITSTRSFFDTIGDTRRQGIELGLSGKVGIVDIKVNYALTEATFQSHFFMLSQNNSSARVTQPKGAGQYQDGRPVIAQQDMIEVQPGDTMPGIPLHNINVTANVHITERWDLGLTMIAHSGSYVRGNENNEHQKGAWEYTWQYDSTAGQGAYRPSRQFTNEGSVPGYAVFNLKTSYDLGKGFTVFGLINNLFDRQYFSAGRLGINPYSPSDYGTVGPSGWNYNSNDWLNTTLVAPGAPRAFWAGVDFRF